MTSKKYHSVLTIHAFATFAVTGLFSFVHFVHYPLFRFIPAETFVEFHNNHIVRFMPIIGMLMTIELLSALALLLMKQDWLWIANFVLVATTWVMTGFWQGPMHIQLGKMYDPVLIETLISTDLWRMLVWFAHGALVLTAMLNPRYQKLFQPLP